MSSGFSLTHGSMNPAGRQEVAMREAPHRSVRIPDPLWEAARIIAERQGIAISEAVRVALSYWVRAWSGVPPTTEFVATPPRSTALPVGVVDTKWQTAPIVEPVSEISDTSVIGIRRLPPRQSKRVLTGGRWVTHGMTQTWVD
jgi:hypothetical protein